MATQCTARPRSLLALMRNETTRDRTINNSDTNGRGILNPHRRVTMGSLATIGPRSARIDSSSRTDSDTKSDPIVLVDQDAPSTLKNATTQLKYKIATTTSATIKP